MRKLATFCAAFTAAVFAARYALPDTWLLPAAGICAVAGVIALVADRRGRRPLQGAGDAVDGYPPRPLREHPSREGNGTRILLVAGAAAIGLVWCYVYGLIFFSPVLELDGRLLPVTAVVTGYPEETALGSRVDVRVVNDSGPDVRAILFAGEDGFALSPGDVVTTTAVHRRADVASSGEEVNYHSAKGVFLLLTSKTSLRVTQPGNIPLDCYPAILQRHLLRAVARVFPDDVSPLVTALVIGDGGALDGTLSVALRRTGLTHVVSVSGMHTAFLIGLLSLLLGRNRRRTAATCIPVLLLFMVAAGATPSIVRATVMNSVLLLAPLLGREQDTPTSLSFALFLLLLQNPYAAAHIGLQLSFAAVLGMMTLSYRLQAALDKRFLRRKQPGKGAAAPTSEKGLARKGLQVTIRFVISSFSASVGALAFTTPLVALYFRQLSLIAPLSNILCLTAVSIVFVGGLFAGLLGGLFLPLGQAAGLIVAPAARYIMGTALLLNNAPFASITTNNVYYRGWVVFVYAILFSILLVRGRTRPVIPICSAVIGLCTAILLTNVHGTAGSLAVSVLDVGQGQSIVLHSGGHVVIVDCGGNLSASAGDIAADYLQDLGLDTVDLLVLTHYHADHANGVPALMARLNITTLAIPDTAPGDYLRQEAETLASLEGTRVQYITEMSTVSLGETAITLYPPMGDGGMNEEGLSILASAGDFDVLITGDMTTYVEERLVKYGNLPDIEVLVAGHHGSKYATSNALLNAVTPEIGIISVGRNSYGHPTPETMERLLRAGAEIYRTDLMGTVTIHTN